MAISRDTVGLLFRLDADTKPAQAELDELQGALRGAVSEMDRESEKGFQKIGNSGRAGVNIIRESVETFSSEFIESFGVDGDIANEIGKMIAKLSATSLAAIAAVIAAFVAAAAAVAALIAVTKQLIDTAKKLGTDSEEDFKKFAEQAKRAGFEVTELDRRLGVGVVKALEDVEATANGVFTLMLREAGPQLIVLLQDVAQGLKNLIPIAQAVGRALVQAFAAASATIRTGTSPGGIASILSAGVAGAAGGPLGLLTNLAAQRQALGQLVEDFKKNFEDALKAGESVNLPSGAFDPKKGGRAKKVEPIGPDARSGSRDAFERDEARRRQKEIDDDRKHFAEILKVRQEFLKRDEEISRLADSNAIERIRDRAKQEIISREEAEIQIAAIRLTRIAEEEDALRKQFEQRFILEAEFNQRVLILSEQRTAIEMAGIAAIREARFADMEEERRRVEELEALMDRQVAAIARGFDAFRIAAAGAADALRESMLSLNEILGTAFEGFAQGVGDLVHNFVLLGETGPAAMRKLLASALATIAAEAAVNAIKALAIGFLRLAELNFPAAAAAFKSAALWGAVAAAAGVAGRAIAPSAGGSGAAAGGAGGGGSAASGPRTIDQDSGRRQVVIQVRAEPGIIVDHVARNYRDNGAIRQVVRRDITPGG